MAKEESYGMQNPTKHACALVGAAYHAAPYATHWQRTD